MIKQAKFTYRGLNRDATKSKHPFEFYYDAKNIIIISKDSQSTYSVANEKGNSLTIVLPEININTLTKSINYNDKSLSYIDNGIFTPEIEEQINNNLLPIIASNHQIIGQTVTRDSIILMSTDSNGFDCIWEVKELLKGNFDLELLYVRNLNFSINNPIQILFNYENENIQKIYWVDGINQLRGLNIKQSIDNNDLFELIDVRSSSLNAVGDFSISNIDINEVLRGGNHTSGKIQYSYNLYNLNGSQSKISPLTELIPLNKGENLGGGAVGEITGTIPVISINNIDINYTHIILYGIKYTSLNQTPEISILLDSEINSNRTLNYFDDGSIITNISLAEFLFLGSDPYIPKHIESKDNILFSANYSDNNFIVDLDMRAYSYNSVGESYILDNVGRINGTLPLPNSLPNIGGNFLQVPDDFSVPERYDSVNPNYDIYKFQKDGVTIGGQGKFIKYTLNQTNLNQTELINPTFFKDREIYRIGIEFYNNLGQTSLPIWIADLQSLDGNLENLYTNLTIELTSDFYVWLNTSSNFEYINNVPIGYRILRAKRDIQDRTIICQGVLNTMVVNYASNTKYITLGDIQDRANSREGIKMPSLMRSFEKIAPITEYSDYHDLSIRDTSLSGDFGSLGGGGLEEAYKAPSSGNWRAQTFQFNKMMQLFSPELFFDNISLSANLNLQTLGLAVAEETNNWGAEFSIDSQENTDEAVFTGGYNSTSATNINNILGNANFIYDKSFFGPTNAERRSHLSQIYKRYGSISKSNNINNYEIYGSPELSTLGEGFRNYNDDGTLRYSNNLLTMLMDAAIENQGGINNNSDQTILGTQSNGAPCATILLGPDDPSYNILNRNNIEDLYNDMNVPETNGAIISELALPNEFKYLSNIYGGNTYEDKRRNEYVKIGSYQNINTSNYLILNPGDTYVERFTFEKFSKTNVSLTNSYHQLTEIVSVNVETSIDLKNRNDLSLQQWDSKFQPNFDEFHRYNNVYSQQNIITSVSDVGFKFKDIERFDSRIISSQLKIPGEFIDSWTDFKINETMDLDGKYGPINSLVNFNDNIYAIQDTGVAYININPRIQAQATDGIAIELGTGNTLYDYNYITTKSGSVNKWSVVSTPFGFYYLDLFNKSYYTFKGGQVFSLSDQKLLHTYFNNNLNFNELIIDNPILKKGISTGYDNENRELYLSVLQSNNSFTLKFNEKMNEFISFYDFKPSFYINKGFRLLTTNDDNKELWEHQVGDYTTYYGVKYPSYITLMINPESDLDCVFNNILYKSELYLDDIDQPEQTLTHITAYNEYQNSGKIPLIFNRKNNLRRKFRKWQANIPRDGRNRIRNPWIFLKLELDTMNNYQLILHDIIINYTI